MIRTKLNKEKERYYLFAGMGGSASRRKRRIMLAWALVAALVVSFALALVMLFINRLHVG
jgi:hypothetical protein